MIDFVEIKYAQLLAGRLDNYRVKSHAPYKINFRCPICGDSEKSKSKTRGWLIEKNNGFYFYCHNGCGSRSFNQFLKSQDNMLFNDYIAEKFMSKNTSNSKKEKERTITGDMFTAPKFNKEKPVDPLKKIKKISQLEWNHPIKRYINRREIPTNQHYRMYFAKKFQAWINTIIPDKFPNIKKDEPRLVIPFLDEDGKMFGCSARGFDPNGIRYISIMFDERPKVFGLDTVDFNREYFILEGALDSMFIENSVAMAGADGNIGGFENIENAVFVFDSEPRNNQIHKLMTKIIKSGYKICIWPDNVPGKDINEMFLNGVKSPRKLIKENTYFGLTAEAKFSAWRKT
jgi:transcription elongation factor Elf1